MEITVTSRETIKPSSPTPPHLKHLKLSLMDQFMPPMIYVRILFFYSSQGDAHRFQNTNMSHRLKRSLSEALAEFYPLAGRYNNNETIECNDQGLEYIESRVKAPRTLGQLLSCPKEEELDRLIPCDVFRYGAGFKGLSAAQVTVFEECGGMTIGVSMSHVLGDASSLSMFVNRWAAIARGDAGMADGNIQPPRFGTSSLFPPRDIPAFNPPEGDHNADAGRPQPEFLTKRFVFGQKKIDALKAKFEYERPTIVEVVSALIFKCLIKVSKSKSSKIVALGMSLDLRRRMSPPVPMRHFGNFGSSWITEHTSPDSLNDLGMQIRKLIRQVDSDYLEKLRADNALLLFEGLKQLFKSYMDNNVRIFQVNSWFRIPFYEVDVGWGTPTWVASVSPYYVGDAILYLDAKNGDGIEVWVTLDEDGMAHFESDGDLLDFASPNPMVCEY